MEQYLKLAQSLMDGFTQFIIAQVLRAENRMADALANLASSALYPCHVELSITDHLSIYNATIFTIEDQAGNSWISLISDYLRNRTLPMDKSKAMKVRAQVARYTLINVILFRQSFSSPYQRCVLPDKVKRIIEQVNGGICGTHISKPSLYHRIMTYGFYWPMLKKESELYVKNCDIYHKFGNIIHVLAMKLHFVSSPWPFYKWGFKIVGSLPLATSQRKIILVAIDYFTKWAEAEAYAHIKATSSHNMCKGTLYVGSGCPIPSFRTMGHNSLASPFSNSIPSMG